MSTFASPTIPSSQLTSDQLTVLAACFSSLVFFFVVIVLLSIIYRKDPQCCKHGCYQDPHGDMVVLELSGVLGDRCDLFH
ncbi:hypothetical protein ILYODFUR_011294 [Ilyodon furcidens]|uniref:Uncharacterized protein n=1 Tax=Ilyodon furcidens TaxID=33524 RepID=A0ABV0T7F2_9TELE